MRFLLRFVVVLVMIYAGLSMVRRLLAPNKPAVRRGRTAGGHLVKDPVCGMYIPQETAIHSGDQFFCSEACREKYAL
jgi:hypothetical protein